MFWQTQPNNAALGPQSRLLTLTLTLLLSFPSMPCQLVSQTPAAPPRIEAVRKLYPVLLWNGNPIALIMPLLPCSPPTPQTPSFPRYTTRIEADRKLYPVLLSNGNLVHEGEAQNGRHFTVWEVRPDFPFDPSGRAS